MGEKLTEELLNELLFSESLETYLNKDRSDAKDSLPERLNRLLAQKGLKKSEVVKRSQLNATFAYQIFSGDRKPSRNKILQIAFAMGLDLRETQGLLKLSGANELYCKDRRDAVIIYCITKQMMLDDADDTLFRFGETTICEE
jgi:transcriptional regulator with XRE-family HTH domain